MTQYTGDYDPRAGGPAAEPSTTDVARGEAADVGQHARDAGGQVAQTAADQARQVAAETSRQARDLLGEAQGHARGQASVQQQRAAQQLHSVADELHAMAANGGQSGVATEVARQAADRIHGAASWLDRREPGDLLNEVRAFARRRPGTFLIGAAVAGLAAGRLTRGLAAKGSSASQDAGNGYPAGAASPAPSAYPGQGEPVAPSAPYPAQPTFTPAGSETSAFPAEANYPYQEERPDPYGEGRADAYAQERPDPYSAEPAYPAEPPYPADSGYPREPAPGPRYEGPEQP